MMDALISGNRNGAGLPIEGSREAATTESANTATRVVEIASLAAKRRRFEERKRRTALAANGERSIATIAGASQYSNATLRFPMSARTTSAPSSRRWLSAVRPAASTTQTARARRNHFTCHVSAGELRSRTNGGTFSATAAE